MEEIYKSNTVTSGRGMSEVEKIAPLMVVS